MMILYAVSCFVFLFLHVNIRIIKEQVFLSSVVGGVYCSEPGIVLSLITEIEDENWRNGPFKRKTEEQNFIAREVKSASS